MNTVTIWNKVSGGTWGTETWYPTVIENTRLLVTRGSNIMRSGVASADSCRLHISDELSKPDKPYATPISWKKSPGRFFTLESENDSFFTEGDTSSEQYEEQEDFFEYMKNTHDNCYRISSVDRYNIVLPHFEVWGK